MKQRLRMVLIAVLAVLTASSLALASPVRLSSITSMLEEPAFVALDARGNLYVTDSEKNKVYIFDVKGGFINSVSVDRPQALAVDTAGNIYVSSYTTTLKRV